MLTNLVAFLAAGMLTLIITPGVKHLARHFDIIDKPDRKRKHHRRLVPLWGGLGVSVALLSSLLICLSWMPDFQNLLYFQDHYLFNRLPGIGVAFLIITFFGLLDDKQPLPPKVKLLVQTIAVMIVLGSGFYIKAIRLPVSNDLILIWPLIGIVLTGLWMLFIVNAFNFIDGVDGLASSQAIVIGLGLMITGMAVSFQSESLPASYQSRLGSVLAAGVAGAALGFYRYNKWPAKIFLGDAGSTLLGFTLCLSGVLIAGQGATAAAPWTVLFILGWPIIDTFQVVIRRRLKGEPVSKADNRHLHHELQKKGFTKTATVAFISFVSIILSGIGIVLLWL